MRAEMKRLNPRGHSKDQKECLAFLRQIIKIRSVNDRLNLLEKKAASAGYSKTPEKHEKAMELPLAVVLEKKAKAMGFTVRRIPAPKAGGYSLWVEHRVKNSKTWVVLNAHMDTVSDSAMELPGGKLARKKHWVCGRGAVDDKGSIASVLWALKAYRAEKPQRNNAAALLVPDEEFGHEGARGSIRFLKSLGRKRLVIIVAEPTSFEPVVAHNGVIRWRVHTFGKAWHSSDPKKGRSAITSMLPVVEALEKKYIPGLRNEGQLGTRPVCSVTQIKTSNSDNVIPDQCTVTVDRRYIAGENERGILRDVGRVVGKLKKTVPRFKYQIKLVSNVPPLKHRPGDARVKAVLEALGKMGIRKKPRGKNYATDGGVFSEAGLSSLVLGPGDIKKAHTRDEYIEEEQVLRGIEVFKNLLGAKIGK
jgi:acetylornithine deacetylase/succinyl-diaminopimelate desuccinylase-like protein